MLKVPKSPCWMLNRGQIQSVKAKISSLFKQSNKIVRWTYSQVMIEVFVTFSIEITDSLTPHWHTGDCVCTSSQSRWYSVHYKPNRPPRCPTQKLAGQSAFVFQPISILAGRECPGQARNMVSQCRFVVHRLAVLFYGGGGIQAKHESHEHQSSRSKTIKQPMNLMWKQSQEFLNSGAQCSLEESLRSQEQQWPQPSTKQ